ncbi:adenosylcobinamide-phosphate synthase CbiB [Vibrio viridaestus]|uniref:Cobalamin biosynthesis protein CobD n=1 Tax=Vibrio viridaestus TaxID=2487322 RepID=A0A3N9TK05_9VIBR|nr:adenosylcobinamide-phosphate synthase CbiB [Vibrio viridaestus]RQW64560.1 cobalamin biosynthesis protein [Vibrio viridaestus]
MSSLLFIMAYLIDLMLGDPMNWPHPIRWIGNSISAVERRLRELFAKASELYFAGLLLWLVIVGGSYVVTLAVIWLAYSMSDVLGFLLQLWLAYTVLATKCLSDSAKLVYDALVSGDIEQSRLKLSYIVGRDTTQLNEKQISRAVVETVAENTVDGVIAPLFYLFIGGVPLAMAYKAVNTLDSMVGYKNEKYGEIGYFSARLDDAANYIPARLSWLCFTLAAKLINCNARQAFKIGWRDRNNHKSPNCAWSEGAVAGALGIRLGGPNVYFGKLVEKPWIGDDVREIHYQDILTTIRLMYIASAIALFIFCLCYWL